MISLFGFSAERGELPGPFHWVDGIAHCIPRHAGPRLVRLADRYALVFVPNVALEPFQDGASCDRCNAEISGQAVATAIIDGDANRAHAAMETLIVLTQSHIEHVLRTMAERPNP